MGEWQLADTPLYITLAILIAIAMQDAAQRLSVEANLIEAYRPPLNEQLNA